MTARDASRNAEPYAQYPANSLRFHPVYHGSSEVLWGIDSRLRWRRVALLPMPQ